MALSTEYAFKWASCEAIKTIQEHSTVTITFKVDMKGAGANISRGLCHIICQPFQCPKHSKPLPHWHDLQSRCQVDRVKEGEKLPDNPL